MSKKKNTAKIIGAYNVVQQGVYNVVIKYGGVEEKPARIITNTILLIILAVLCGWAIYGFSILNSKLDAIRNDSAKEDKAVYFEITTTSPLITIESTESTLPLTTTTTPTSSPSETLQTTTNTSAITAAATSHFVQTQPTSIQQPQETEPTEPPKTTTVTQTEPPTEPTVPPTEPPTEPRTEPPTDPPIVTGVDNDFEYRIENCTATITKYQGTETVVVVPEYVAGVPVHAIGEEAFAGNEEIQELIIKGNWSRDFAGETLEHTGTREIGKCAFLNCLNLMKVELPSSITFIGDEAFAKSTPDIHIKICYMDSGDRWDEISKNNAGLDVEYITVETYPNS